MENRFGIYDILQNIREDEQRLERLIADLKKGKKAVPLSIQIQPSRPPVQHAPPNYKIPPA